MTDVEHLIDISGYNAVTDWNAVRANGIVGASIKVSQQVNYLNPLCGVQAAGARAAGVAPGGYHFGDPRVSAADQARYFVEHASPHGLFDDDALAPMYDAENWEGGGLVWPSPKVLNDHIAEHIRVVREETGVRRHLVYGSLSWWGSWIDPDLWADDDVLLWIAVYNGDPGNLQGWDHPNDVLHQHTSSGIVPGIPGQVDKNVTLRGRRIGDLVIKQQEDNMAGSDDFNDVEEDRVLAAAGKQLDDYRVTDGGPGDVRPDDYPLDRPDDQLGHTLTMRAWQQRHIGLSKSMNSGVARVETVVNGNAAADVRIEASLARIEAALTSLAVGGQTQEGFDALFRTSPLTGGLLREGAVFVDNDPPNPPSGG